MKKSHIIIQLLLTAFSASIAYAEIEINELPFNCNSSNETYTISDNLISSGTAIFINADNVIINGNNKEITYSSTSAGNGIELTGFRTNIQINNLTINQGLSGGTGIRSYGGRTTDLNINNVTINITNESDYGILFKNQTGDISGLKIDSSQINMYPKSGSVGSGILIETPFNVYGTISNNNIVLGGTLSAARPGCIKMADAQGALNIDSNICTLEGPDDNNGVIFWASSGHKISHNTINMNCYHCRGILIDGGSDNNTINHNTITMNTSGSCSGIRLRYGSDNNTIHNNIVDSSDAQTGLCLRYGERQESQPNDYPDNNTIHDNSFSGISPVVQIENGSDSTLFYNNTVTSTTNGICYNFLVWSGISPNTISNLTLSNETCNTTNIHKISLDAQDSQLGEFSNILFCQSGVEEANIQNTKSITGWSINNQGPCPTIETINSPIIKDIY